MDADTINRLLRGEVLTTGEKAQAVSGLFFIIMFGTAAGMGLAWTVRYLIRGS